MAYKLRICTPLFFLKYSADFSLNYFAVLTSLRQIAMRREGLRKHKNHYGSNSCTDARPSISFKIILHIYHKLSITEIISCNQLPIQR